MRHVARARTAMLVCDSRLKRSSCVAVSEVKMSLSSGVIQEPIVKHDEPAELIFGQNGEEKLKYWEGRLVRDGLFNPKYMPERF